MRAGERSARSVVEEHLAAIDAREDELHAFNLVMRDEALAAADAVDAKVAAGEDPGPLAGVPVALKDNLCTTGVPTTCSSKILEGWKPPYDATVVERLAAAGAIAIGKTNLDEFAMGSSTENSAFGPSKNPHDPTKVPGGSSGGSAVAVAAGFAPLGARLRHRRVDPPARRALRRRRHEAHLRAGEPLRAGGVRVEPRPDRPVRRHRRRRRRCSTTSSPATTRATPPRSRSRRRPTLDVLDQGVDGLRVGLVTELCQAEGIAADVTARVQAAAEALGNAGAKVDEVSVPAAIYGLSAYYLIAPAEASSNLARYDGVRYGLRVDAPTTGEMYDATRTAGFGAEVERRIMLGTYALSAGYYDAYYGKAQKVRTLIIRDFDAAYEQLRRAAVAHVAHHRVHHRRQGRSAGHVPQRRVHDPVEPGRPPRHLGAVRRRATTACPSACRCWRPRSTRRRCSGSPPRWKGRCA